MEKYEANAPVPVIHARGFAAFSIAIFILSASVSFLAFFYGLLIISLDRNIRKNHIVRVIVVVQGINCLRFIIRILVYFIPIYSDVGCRVLLFLTSSTTILPINLCVYCVLYLQIVVIHKVSPYNRWPQIGIMTLAVLIAVIPPASFLYFPPSRLALESYCKISDIFRPKGYVFYLLTVALWEYFSGAICIISVVIIGIYILRARRAAQRIEEGATRAYGLPSDLVQQNQSKALHHTLITIIWYPITPIISQWLNLILVSLSYYLKRTYTGLEFLNVALLGVQSVLLGIGLVVYPAIQRVSKKNLWNRWVRSEEKIETHSAIASNEVNIERGLSPLSYSRLSSVYTISSDSISDFQVTFQST